MPAVHTSTLYSCPAFSPIVNHMGIHMSISVRACAQKSQVNVSRRMTSFPDRVAMRLRRLAAVDCSTVGRGR
jgi:hypothetical protein